MSKSTMDLQLRIRQNALEMQDFYSDLDKWEADIAKRDKELQKKKKQKVILIKSNPEIPKPVEDKPKEPKPPKPADAHTYDKGYKKWEKFDVDGALKELDESDASSPTATSNDTIVTQSKPIIISPADIGRDMIVNNDDDEKPVNNSSLESENTKPLDVLEREKGNKYFSEGNFEEALKCYTKSIALNSQSAVSFSNRAMTYLKLKEYKNAEEDCDFSLKLDNTFVKSYYRRALAKNGECKHRSAVMDLKKALEIDPNNKTVKMELNKTREIINNNLKIVPFIELTVSE